MRYFSLILLFFSIKAFGQVSTNPSFPKADEPVTFTVDVSGTALSGYTGNVWIWTWIPQGNSAIDAPTNVNPATDAQNAALMTRSTGNTNLYTITFTPTEFFNVSASEINRIGLLLKGRDWSNGQTPDYFVDMSTGEFEIYITSPSETPVFLQQGQDITLSAVASESSNLKFYIDNIEVASVTQSATIEHIYTTTDAGRYNVKVVADNGSETSEDATYFIVENSTINETRPEGIIAGINYITSSSVILDLLAPNKTSVYVIGDFTDWEVDPEYQMKKDGEHFWLEIDNRTSGVEYGFQYLVDESIYIADPFADKILDPDDQYIPSEVYPNLKSFPERAYKAEWYFNRISVFEINSESYEWQNEQPVFGVDSLIIYELLIRDFFAHGERSYLNLIDTLSYLKDLGVNAIELMPVMEFSGNESWGYNPTFMFAPDKYYGTKNDLKKFIDEAHGMNMAVILDIVYNHQEIPNSFLMMDFNYGTYKPTANNKFYNINATHPFSVFFDLNHESVYTQSYIDTINHYWLNEYKVDGFRYDLSKGFTQKNSGGDVNYWSQYDASRIQLLKRMNNEIREYAPNAILILEHFADNTEETELSNEGFLLWGNLNHSYSQAAMGYASGSDISWGYYENRGWDDANVVTYMESHDEERLSYRIKEYGASSSGYYTGELANRIERLKAAALMLYTLPGPKLIWQWGEWGYDIPIDENGRTGIKPIPWDNIDGLDYYNSPERKSLYNFYKALLNLRRDHKVFNYGNAEISNISNNLLHKQITLKSDPYTSSPAGADDMNVVVVSNFDISAKELNVSFPHNGNWYSYFTGSGDLTVNNLSAPLVLNPGEFRLFTDVQLEKPLELITSADVARNDFSYYPNPVKSELTIQLNGSCTINICDLQGRILSSEFFLGDVKKVSMESFSKGFYIIEIVAGGNKNSFKIIKQ